MESSKIKIILHFLKNNIDNVEINIYDRINMLKLGTALGFDINEAKYKNHGINILAITMIDENKKVIEGQRSNKLIILNSNLNHPMEIDFTIAYAVVSYILNKENSKTECFKMSDIYTRNYIDEEISNLALAIMNPEAFVNSGINVIKKPHAIRKKWPSDTRMPSIKISKE